MATQERWSKKFDWADDTNKTHIGNAVDIIQGLITYDIDTYKSVIITYFKSSDNSHLNVRINDDENIIKNQSLQNFLKAKTKADAKAKAGAKAKADAKADAKIGTRIKEIESKEAETIEAEIGAEIKATSFQKDSNDYTEEDYTNLLKEYLINTILKDRKNEDTIYDAKLEIALHVFCSLSISCLKAEYSIFDNYSEKLDEITGFTKDKYLISNYFIKNEDTDDIKYSKNIDHYLVKSTITSIWYLIEQCKIISHCVEKETRGKTLIGINNERKERITAIYPFRNDAIDFLPKDIIKLFEQTFETIIDMTIIDNRFYFSESNINKLFQAVEKIKSLKKILLGQSYEESQKKIDEGDYLIRTYKNNNTPCNRSVGELFLLVEKIVNTKCYLMIYQMIKHFDSINLNSDFKSKYNFILYGLEEFQEPNKRHFDFGKFQEYAERLKNNIGGSTFTKELEKCRENKYTEVSEYVLFGKATDIDYTDSWNDLNKVNIGGNPHEDIYIYNKSSKDSIRLYCENSKILKLSKLICDDKAKEDERQQFISLFVNSRNKGEGDTVKIEENPSALGWILKAAYKLLTECYDIKNPSENPHSDSIFETYEYYFNLFDEYIKDKQYDISELNVFPPFQWSFYEINISDKHSSRADEIKYAPLNHKLLENKDILEKKLISESKPYFFFRSYGLNPLNLYLLKQENEEFLSQYYEIKYLKMIYESKKITKQQQEQLQQRYTEEQKRGKEEITEFKSQIEKDKQTNITILGILGSFIAFVSFATGTLRAVDTVAEFVIFAVVFCVAVGFLGFFIRNDYDGIKNFFKEHKKTFDWFVGILITVVILSFVYFVYKDYNKNEDKKIIIQQEVHSKTESKTEAQSNASINVSIDTIKKQTDNQK